VRTHDLLATLFKLCFIKLTFSTLRLLPCELVLAAEVVKFELVGAATVVPAKANSVQVDHRTELIEPLLGIIRGIRYDGSSLLNKKEVSRVEVEAGAGAEATSDFLGSEFDRVSLIASLALPVSISPAVFHIYIIHTEMK
jgi:hypothetical protein